MKHALVEIINPVYDSGTRSQTIILQTNDARVCLKFLFLSLFTTLFSLHYGKSSKALQNIGLVCWLRLQNWWPNKDNSSSQELSFSEEFCQQLFPLMKAMAFGHAHPVGVHSFGGTILCPLYGIQEPSSCFGYPNLELFGKQLRVL